MTQVNLLPWREEARKIKKLRFLAVLILFVSVSIVAILILHIFISGVIHAQKNINNYIQSQLAKEQGLLTQFNKKKKENLVIMAELQKTYGLQNKSFKAVTLMNTFSNIMPEGAKLTKLVREGDHITLIGNAQSSLEVTALMENIVKTHRFNQPVLTAITGQGSDKGESNATSEKLFQIKVVQKEN